MDKSYNDDDSNDDDEIDETTTWLIDEFIKDISKPGEDKTCKF